ncbi:MAG: UDP-N-acetylglucosamine 2-epimerase (non-hydrolyzing) [Candidatus Acidiferrum sp.]
MESTDSRTNGANLVWVSIVGARPQFVKLAPVCRAIEAHNKQAGRVRIDHRIIHTGQHYDREVTELLFVQMAIPDPNHNLAVGSGSHGTQIARMLARMEPILVSKRIDWVIVYGDTNSTLAGALLASRLKLPLAHVEAGCRSEDIGMPEEQNRIVADHLSQVLLAPSQSAVENLRREGIGIKDDPRKRRVAMVGDVMYDALLQNVRLAEDYEEETLRRLNLETQGYYLLTLHRAENTNNPERLTAILEAVSSLDLPVLFPIHPRTKQILAGAGISLNGSLRPVAPLGYLEMLAAERHARKILTDSGGVQKEAFYLGIPCVTLRDRTEWPETVEAGANRIAGVSATAIREAVREEHHLGIAAAQPYGDGKAAQKIVRELLSTRNSPIVSVVEE